MKIRVTIKAVTAIRKGRFNSQVCLTIGDFRTAKLVSIPGVTDDIKAKEAVMPEANEQFDWLCSLQNKTVTVSDE